MSFVEITTLREVFFLTVLFGVFYFLLKKIGDLQRNLAVLYVTVFYAFLSGLGSVISFLVFPEQLTRPNDSFNAFSYHLALFSISYFTYDTIRIIIFGEVVRYWRFIVHHIFMLSSGLVVMHIPTILPVAMVALLAEVNTIFMQIRLIFKFYGFGAQSRWYKINLILMFATVPFRLLPPLWIAGFSIFYQSESIILLFRLIFIFCAIFITIYNYYIIKILLVIEGYIGILVILFSFVLLLYFI